MSSNEKGDMWVRQEYQKTGISENQAGYFSPSDLMKSTPELFEIYVDGQYMNITSAKQVFKNAVCIDFRTLIRSKNVFNQHNFDLVKKSLGDNKSAGIVVHPLFFNDFVKSSKEKKHISDNYFVQQAVNKESYSKYANNLRNFLNSALFPVFIFYDPDTSISLNNPFIRDINTNTPLIFVRTLPADVAPAFFARRSLNYYVTGGFMLYIFNVNKPWNLLQDTFLDLGIKNFTIGGEKGYIEESDSYVDGKYECGCVYGLAKKLRRMNFNYTIDINMVFPGVTVQRHREK